MGESNYKVVDLENLFENYGRVFWDSSGFMDRLPKNKMERGSKIRKIDIRDQKEFVDSFVDTYFSSKRCPFYITDKVGKEIDPRYFNPDDKPTKETQYLNNIWRFKLLEFFNDKNRILNIGSLPSKIKDSYSYFYNEFFDLAKEKGLDYKLDSEGNGNKCGLGTDKELAFMALAYSFEKSQKTSLITNDKAIWKFIEDVNYHEDFSYVDVYGRVGKEIFKKFV